MGLLTSVSEGGVVAQETGGMDTNQATRTGEREAVNNVRAVSLSVLLLSLQ